MTAVPRAAAGVAAAGLLTCAVTFAGAPGAVAAAPCDTIPQPGPVSTATPYEDRLYDLDRLAAIATGRDVRVAVVDSGVDDEHPQLAGRVAAGRDFLRGGANGRQDCAGHGTGVASVIVAGPVRGVVFHGLAPDATVVPVRISEQEEIDGKAVGAQGGLGQFAQAIRWASDPSGGGAQVINLSLVTGVDDRRVRAAVAQALDRGVVVVAAAGNNGGAGQANATPYPAAYPGVIGVGAVTADGVRADYSQRGDYVDLVAPGSGVTVAAVGSGHTVGDGTSFAAPFVSATAALIVQRFPGSTPAQVRRRLVATADPAPGGRRSDGYGFGVLNPYRAVTETLGPEQPAGPVPVSARSADPLVAARELRRERSRDAALVVAGAGVGLVLVAMAVTAVVRSGRRRRWRP
ncbi:type VII secretion-associated serine protease mycosin [Mangrovihabitans endophyticus]|uniref:type VII secretion-associated serine protease mycosin n=1 Tax=Mangrovihabitans endophyticus TaxID=1751298 RepID=UPI00166A6B2E|nr:type VII secretion-associated serine protease mycosin [Mangrovihabitans endophyticus]